MKPAPDPKQQYLNEDGTINWDFLKKYNPPALTDEELRVRQVFASRFNCYYKVKLLLAEWGEYTITTEDLEQQEEARRTSVILQREREDCYIRHSLWARGRKTATAPR